MAYRCGWCVGRAGCSSRRPLRICSIREGILDVGPTRSYALEDIVSAYRDLESRQIIGAAVIRP